MSNDALFERVQLQGAVIAHGPGDWRSNKARFQSNLEQSFFSYSRLLNDCIFIGYALLINSIGQLLYIIKSSGHPPALLGAVLGKISTVNDRPTIQMDTSESFSESSE
ncbi:hypothetical protein EVAR_35931_1 [Eumeta japonica]|uniref:Uncharacterized protein n=1 Tax=Eumeta variegata TaxID=151549 RepID=A0A4C1W674_EUMVA|nr:hypothetical protein EVAR_35931_1 [Eumeta japonica]